ncbi:hypothetical protein GCM10010216_51980 [Streptomyces flaveolus]|nr:hypothetical protein GCM10010216_51980 [Streptomyces flaveolus]
MKAPPGTPVRGLAARARRLCRSKLAAHFPHNRRSPRRYAHPAAPAKIRDQRICLNPSSPRRA